MPKTKPTYEELEKRILFIEKAMNRISDGCIALDNQMKFVVLNKGGASFFNRDPRDLVGKNIFHLFPVFSETAVAKAYQDAYRNQISSVVDDYSQERKCWYSHRIYPSKEGVSIFIHEITESERDEALLKRTELKVRTLIDELPQGMLVASEETQKFIFANNTICRNLGYTQQELEGLSIMDIHPAEELPHIISQFQKIVHGEIDKVEDVTVIRKDGSTFSADIQAVSLILDGIKCSCGVFTDITERKLAEQKIHAARKKEAENALLLKQAQKMANVGFWELEIQSKCMTLSEEMYSILDQKPAAFNNTFESYLNFVHPDDRALVQDTYNEHLQTKKEYDIVHRILTPNNQIRYINERCVTSYDPESKTLKSLGVVADITYLRRAEEALRESESKYRILFESSPIGIVATDANEDTLLVNKKFTEITGYTIRDVASSEAWWSLAYPDTEYRISVREKWEQTVLIAQLKQSDIIPVEVRIVCKDGSTRNIEIGYVAAGRYNIMTFVDITERKLAAQKIWEQEARLDQLAIHSRTIAWEVNAEGLYTYISPIVKEVFGFEPIEIIGKKHFYDLHPQEGREAFRIAAFEVFKRKEKFIDLENKVEHKNGQAIWVSTNGIPILAEDGNLKGYRGSDTDISTRKKTEAALVESEKEYHRLFENMAQGVVYQDEEGVITKANPAAESLLGLSLEQMTGLKSIDPTWHAIREDGSDFPGIEHPAMEALRTGKPVRDILMGVFNSSKGDYNWILVNAEPEFKEGATSPFQVFTTFTDINELKNAKIALQESETNLKAILESSLESIWSINKQYEIIFANKEFTNEFRNAFGATLERGVNIIESIPDPLRPIWRSRYDKVLNNERLHFIEHITLPGRLLTFDILMNPIVVNGQVTAVAVFSKDITEQEEAKKALLESEANFRLIAENVPDVFWLRSADNSKILYVNPAYEKIYGRSSKDLYESPHSYLEAVLEADREMVNAAFENYFKTEQFEVEFRIQRPNQQVRWLHTTSSPVKDSLGKIIGHTGLAIDITDKKKFELELIEKNKQLNLIIQNIPGAVFSCIKDENCHMLFISDFIKEISGYEPCEINKGRTITFNQLIHPDDSRKLRVVMEKAFAKKEKYTFIYRLRHRNGKNRWVYEIGEFESFDGSMENKKIDGILFDLTEKIRAEEEKLSAIFKATDEERTRISHDIHDGLQQTLVACKMNFEMLKKEVETLNPKLQERYKAGLDIIEYAIQESRTISRSLLPKHVNDFGFIVAVENLISNLDKKVAFNFYHHDLVIHDENVSLNLYRITQEAINNILKHSGATKVQIGLTNEKDRMVYTIEDNGHGFNTDEMMGPEKGIGLQSMKSRASGIGANFEIFSQIGKGTLIAIDLPAGL